MAELGETLSERELDVLRCVVRGASNKEIAAELFISQNTVKVHLRNIFTKLGVSSRAETMTVALQQGLVTLPGGSMVPIVMEEPIDETAAFVSDTTNPPLLPETPPIPEFVERVTPPQRRWLVPTVAVGVLLMLLLVGYWATQAFNNPPAPTVQAFQETAVAGDDRWIQTQPMTAPRAGMATAAIGLNVYYIGGETSTGVTADVHVYHTPERTWERLAEKPTAVTHAAVTVLFGEIYVVGGRQTDGKATNLVEVYSPTNNAWREVEPLPQPVVGGLALTDGSFLYLFGGWDGVQYLDTAYAYDLVTNQWRPLPPMPQARAFMVGGLLTGSFYVAGGFDGTEELRDCAFWDLATQSWATCPDMTSPRAGAGSAVLLNKLYVMGGGWQAENKITFNESYDPNTQTWQIINTPMLADGSNWIEMGVAPVETRIFMTGGRRDGQLTADHFVFTALYQTYLPAVQENTTYP